MSFRTCFRCSGMSYAETNGISLYYEEHGTGDPLVLLHGGFGSLENFDGVREALSAGRRLVLVDLQGHGRTPDADRPLRIETLADDVAGPDRAARRHGRRARVLLRRRGRAAARASSTPSGCATSSWSRSRPSATATSPRGSRSSTRWTRASPSILRQTPVWATYERVAPDPAAFDAVVAKTVDLLHHDYDWTAEVEAHDAAHAAACSPTRTRSAPTTCASSPACSGSATATRARTARPSRPTSSPSCPA